MASRLGYLGHREAELRRVRARSWRGPRECALWLPQEGLTRLLTRAFVYEFTIP